MFDAPKLAPHAAFALHRAYLAAHHALERDVDFAQSAVVAPDPSLGLDRVGLPRSLASRLFFFHLVGELVAEKSASTPALALSLLERGGPWLPRLLERVVDGHPVIVSRREMLDRSGMQAFLPVLVDGEALRLSPMAMNRVGLIPDGSCVSVLLPLSERAQREALDQMGARASLRSPVDGSLSLPLSPEALVGLFALTEAPPAPEGHARPPRHFGSAGEVAEALERGELVESETVRVGRGPERRLTTAGRASVAAMVPVGNTIDALERPMGRGSVRALLERAARALGDQEAATLALSLEALGVAFASRIGLSLGIDDVLEPPDRQAVLDEACTDLARVREMYEEGLITDGERYNKTVDVWASTADRMGWGIQKAMEGPKACSPLALMVRAGAVEQGSFAARKLGGMVGLVSRAWGEIVERPVLSSMRRGLSPHERLLIELASRRAEVHRRQDDRRRRTMLRRLTEALRGLSVVEHDCRAPAGLLVRSIDGDPTSRASPWGRLEGRVAAREVWSLGLERDILVPSGTIIAEEEMALTEREGPGAVEVRSPVGCEAEGGLCEACTGRRLGEPVGTQAAQALAEASSRLGRRRFPVSDAIAPYLWPEAWSWRGETKVTALASGRVSRRRGELATRRDGALVVVSPDAELIVVRPDGELVQASTIPHGSTILCELPAEVEHGQALAEWLDVWRELVADRPGRVVLLDIVEGVTHQLVVNEVTGLATRQITEPAPGSSLAPRLMISSPLGARVVPLEAGASLLVADGDEVLPGDRLAQFRRPWTRLRSDVPGFPHLDLLLDGATDGRPSELSEVSGVASLEGTRATGLTVVVTPDPPLGEPRRHRVEPGRFGLVREGDRVRAGDRLTWGEVAPASLLRVVGRPETAAYLVDLLLDAFWLGGATIEAVHVEVAVAAMLRFVRVIAPGDSSSATGELVPRPLFLAENERLEGERRRPATAEQALVGLTTRARQLRRALRAASGPGRLGHRASVRYRQGEE